ncbi:MAG: aspartyl protease family protein [Pyrinomonadaceae bacterium]
MKSLAALTVVIAAVLTAFAQRSDPGDLAFTSGTSTELPFRTVNNLILITASVNGSKPGTFIFDTGAESTVVDTAFADSLRLKKSGKTTGNGAAGSATAGVIKNANITVGGLRAAGMTVYSLPLGSFTPSFAVPIDGIIGNDIIGKVVAQIDYAKGVLRLIQPSVFSAPTNADMVPLLIDGGLPFIKTDVTPISGKPIDARMEIDTGSTGAVLLNSPFVQKHALVKTLPASLEKKTGGVGGTGASRVGRLSSLKFGTTTLRDPIVVLYSGTKGDNASSEYDGLIGGGVLRRFKITVDIMGKRLFLEPQPNVGDRFDTDMSGMELLADGPDLKEILIDEVTPGSAAAVAGIRGGDKLMEVDGRPVTVLGLEEVKRLFRQDGTSYEVTVLRKGKPLHYRVQLKRLI